MLLRRPKIKIFATLTRTLAQRSYPVICALAVTTSAQAFETKNFHSERKYLSQATQKKLRKHYPIVDTAVDARGNVWLLTHRALWRWNVETAKLKKLAIKSSEPLKKLVIHRDFIFIASDRYLQKLSFSPLNLERIQHPVSTKGTTMALNAQGNQLHWMNSAGIVILEKDQKPQVHRPRMNLGTVYSYWLQPKKMIFREKQRLLEIDSNGKQQPFHSSKNKILALRPLKDGTTVAYTSKSLLRFDLSLKLLQIIPVSGTRKLQAASFHQNQHYFFFEDGLFEIYDLIKQKRLQSQLTKTKVFTRKISFNQGTIAILTSPSVLVYKVRIPEIIQTEAVSGDGTKSPNKNSL